jgi:hypothetical protein
MAEIRERGRILAAQLFLSTAEIRVFYAAKKCIAWNFDENYTSRETRVEQGLSCIDFQLKL